MHTAALQGLISAAPPVPIAPARVERLAQAVEALFADVALALEGAFPGARPLQSGLMLLLSEWRRLYLVRLLDTLQTAELGRMVVTLSSELQEVITHCERREREFAFVNGVERSAWAARLPPPAYAQHDGGDLALALDAAASSDRYDALLGVVDSLLLHLPDVADHPEAVAALHDELVAVDASLDAQCLSSSDSPPVSPAARASASPPVFMPRLDLSKVSRASDSDDERAAAEAQAARFDASLEQLVQESFRRAIEILRSSSSSSDEAAAAMTASLPAVEAVRLRVREWCRVYPDLQLDDAAFRRGLLDMVLEAQRAAESTAD